MRRDMPGRLLRLLTLLQTRRTWSGAELAQRLDITDRTLRRDIERLRDLDYPVEGTTGTAGGYRLRSGTNLPPLVFDDDEAIAVALGLVSAGGLPGVDESAIRALIKLEQVLPARLRSRLTALADATAAVPHRDAPTVDPTTLVTLATCCRDHEILTFDYRGRGSRSGARRVAPISVVTTQGRWYLVAWDPEADDWRTFRVDRMERPASTHRSFVPRELPGGDPAAFLRESFARATYRHGASVTVNLTEEQVRAGIFGSIPGTVEPNDAGGCVVHLTAEDPALVVQYVAAVVALGETRNIHADDETRRRITEIGHALCTAC